ncbi:malonate decarboxylase holo-ACP synthase [Chondromyces crocatus]|uniref:Phosphoribosyl-dephospho-CoA transferase n=1 Tax=Chondromyces crocatus TaxID=52 RepID=A0A0K1ESH4_CHOCO|nr:malonate decarboxylase holo-ACP synthase [Chondromyces crocatus]AKT43890.1 phosphoribosyl-dephospho-CoA transferase [Chondromyces crocatus]
MPADAPPRPHDLLHLTDPSHLVALGDIPTWVSPALTRAPWVVVRRAQPLDGLLAVGVRGATRSERFAAFIAPDHIDRVVSPEDLAHAHRADSPHGSRDLPAFRALACVALLLAPTGIPWGPAGSVGFELASGWPAVTPGSDLDLLLRPTSILSRHDASALLAHLTAHLTHIPQLPCIQARHADAPARPPSPPLLHAPRADVPVRIDVQLETPRGAIALAEYASATAEVLARTPLGPQLVTDPWASPPLPSFGASLGLSEPR